MTEKSIGDAIRGNQEEISTETPLRAPSRIVRIFTRFFIEQKFENAAEAARRAGSTSKVPNQVAYQWLQDPWVQREIETAKMLMNRGEDPLQLIREDDVVEKLVRIYEEAMAKGKFDPAIKSVELMGKHIGMFSPESALKKKEIEKLAELKMDEERYQNLSKALIEARKSSQILEAEAKEVVKEPDPIDKLLSQAEEVLGTKLST